MTAPASASYLDSQGNLQRTPLYKIKFDNWDVPYSTQPIRTFTDSLDELDTVSETVTISETKQYVLEDDYPHIDHSVVGDLFLFDGESGISTTKPYASQFSGQEGQVFPEQGHSSIGSMSFVLTDVDEDVTNLVMSGIIGERAQILAGFDDIDESDYRVLFTGIVANIRSSNGIEPGYEFTLYAPSSFLNRQVFNVTTTITTTELTAGFEAAFSVDPASGTFSGLGVYVRIDDEIFWCDVIDSETGVIGILSRAMFGTIAAEHAIGAEAREILVLEGHPIEILLGLFLNTDKTGCAMNPTYVDMEAHATAITLIGTVYEMRFLIDGPENALEWASREIYQPLGCYPVTTSDGKISIVVFHAPSADESVATIDHDSILTDEAGRPKLNWSLGRDGSLGQVINDVTFRLDWNSISQAFESTAQFERIPSIERFGRYPLVIESKGLRFDISGTDVLLVARAFQLLNRYENGSPLVTLTTSLQDELVEPGDIIGLTSSMIPNKSTKTRGVSEALMEVVNRNIRFDDGEADFQLLWTSFADLSRDDFNRANVLWSDDPLLGTASLWICYAQDLQGIRIESEQLFLGRGGAKIIPAGSGHGIALRTQNYGANQFSQLTFRSASGSGGFAGPVVRGGYTFTSAPPDYLVELTGYAAVYETNFIPPNITLRYYNNTDPIAGTGSELAIYPVTLVDGDTVRIDVRGTQLRVFLNDVLIIGPIYHGGLTTGQVGGLSNYTGTAGGILWDSWLGGDNGWA